MLETVNTEEIGTLKILQQTKASQSVAEGKGLHEGTVGSKALFKSFQYRPVLSFGKSGSSVGMLQGPWGLAVNDWDEITVIDSLNHRVQIFNSSGYYSRGFGQQGNKAGEFNYPRGIAFHKNGNIFVADEGNRRIQIFSREGEYLGMFEGKGTPDYQLYNPWGLSVDSDGNIIVADTGDKFIKTFSSNGEFLMKIGGKVSLTFPIHCIQCGFRYLIVSDRDEHCIKVFDRNGNFVYKFGKRGKGKGDFKYPHCLSVNKSGHLM